MCWCDFRANRSSGIGYCEEDGLVSLNLVHEHMLCITKNREYFCCAVWWAIHADFAGGLHRSHLLVSFADVSCTRLYFVNRNRWEWYLINLILVSGLWHCKCVLFRGWIESFSVHTCGKAKHPLFFRWRNEWQESLLGNPFWFPSNLSRSLILWADLYELMGSLELAMWSSYRVLQWVPRAWQWSWVADL